MLRAIIDGKAGRIESAGESVSWRHLFKSREDLLTAAIFSRWSYLSLNAKHSLLKEWVKDLELSNANYKDIEFWPKYDLVMEGRNFVEPDVLIRYEEFDVLIEVKPPQNGGQTFGQWERELEGYLSAGEDMPLHFLAIGRNSVHAEAWKSVFMERYKRLQSMHTINWKSVANTVHEITKLSDPESQDHRILLDMTEALRIYGVTTHIYKWSDFNPSFDDFRGVRLPNISLLGDVASVAAEPELDTGPYSFQDLMANNQNISLEAMTEWKK